MTHPLVDAIQAKSFQLSNGLTVFFSENPLNPSVYAAIVIRAGGRHGPDDNTGLAHYLEHLLFKGTDKLGTLDWQKEQPFYDRLIGLYEQRFKESDLEKKDQLTQDINKVSAEAAKYTNPQELIDFYNKIGGKSLNAHTSLEHTSYHLEVPKNRLTEWAELEKERFRNPIFRGFQWELETVYEEKNRTKEKISSVVYEHLMAELFPGHPYGTRTILGAEDHLKNPSLQSMIDFYKKQYVPSNMAIIVSGDISFEELKKTIEKHFADWKPSPAPPREQLSVKPLTETKRITLLSKESPYLSLGFQAPSVDSPDFPLINIAIDLLASPAGLLVNNLDKPNRVLSSGAVLRPNSDGSSVHIYAQPKEKQTMAQLETLLNEQIGLLLKGEYDDGLIQAIVLNMTKDALIDTENNAGRVSYLRSAYSHHLSLDKFANQVVPQQIPSKKDITSVVQKYFMGHKVVIAIEDGTPQRVRMDKPVLDPQNYPQGQTSAFTAALASRKPPPIAPKFIDFKSDVQKHQIRPGLTLYQSLNPAHDLGSLTINFQLGEAERKDLSHWLDAFAKRYCKDLDKDLYFLGVSSSTTFRSTKVSFDLKGIESNLTLAGKKIVDCLASLKFDASIHAELAQKSKDVEDYYLKNQNIVSNAVLLRFLENEQSTFLNYPFHKEILDWNQKHLTSLIDQLFSAPLEVYYVGKASHQNVTKQISNLFPQKTTGKATVRKPKQFWVKAKEPTLYFYHLPNLEQAHINALAPLNDLPPDRYRDRALNAAFNNYFGSGSMNTVLFREVRDKRGLAYSVHGRLTLSGQNEDYQRGDHGRIAIYVGTQADKTKETIQLLDELVKNPPQIPGDMQNSIQTVDIGFRTSPTSFWSIPSSVATWEKMELDPIDPNAKIHQEVASIKPDEVFKFGQSMLKQNPLVWVVIGDETLVRPDKIAKDLGFKLEKLGPEDVFGFARPSKSAKSL